MISFTDTELFIVVMIAYHIGMGVGMLIGMAIWRKMGKTRE